MKKISIILVMSAVLLSGLSTLSAGWSDRGIETTYFQTAAMQIEVGTCVVACNGVEYCTGQQTPYYTEYQSIYCDGEFEEEGF